MIGDLERISSRIAASRVTPRELVQLKNSLAALELLKAAMESTDCERLHELADGIDPLEEVRERIAREIYPDPQNNQIQKGGVIADGVDPELDDLRRIALHGKDVPRAASSSARARRRASRRSKSATTTSSATTSRCATPTRRRCPPTWIRKQTLTNAERYITEELKEYEEKILGAEEKMLVIEQRIYAELMADICAVAAPYCCATPRPWRASTACSPFARIACERRYVRPVLDEGSRIDIRARAAPGHRDADARRRGVHPQRRRCSTTSSSRS